MNIFSRLFGSSNDDQEIKELVDKLDAYSDALNENIAQKQAEYEELCKQSDKAKAEVKHLEKAVKYLDN
jgi:predicted  nucleic acid-binding Zn-ribbon protein